MADANNIEINLALKGLAQVEAGIQRLNAGFSGLRNATAGVASAMLAFSGLSKITSSIDQVAQLGAELVNLRERTGATIPQLLSIRKALKETGVGADDAAGLVAKMQRTLATAAYEGGAAEKAFTQLGLSVQDLAKLGPAQQLAAIGERIAAVEDPALRAALAMEIFGRDGAKLLATFRNGEAMEALAKGAGTFGEVMERNADRLHAFEVLVGRVKGSGTKFWAGFLDMLPIDAINTRINDALNALDVTKAGQFFGAWVGVGVEQIQAGKLDQFIALSIDAGFELGGKAALATWEALCTWIGGYTPKVIVFGVVAAASEITKLIGQGIIYVMAGFDTAMAKLVSSLRYAFEWVFGYIKRGFVAVLNWLLEQIETALNAGLSKAGKLMGVDTAGVQFGRIEPPSSLPPQGAVSWGEAWEKSVTRSAYHLSAIEGFFKNGTDAARELLGLNEALTGEADSQGTALERITRLMDDYARRREEIALAAKKEHAAGNLLGAPVNVRAQLLQSEFELKERLLALERMRNQNENSFDRSRASKWQERRGILLLERQAMEDKVKFLREKLELQGLDTDTRNDLQRRLDTTQGQLNANENQLGGMGANPYSYADQMQVAFTSILDQVGTVAEQIGRTFTSVIGSAIDGIASGIYGLLNLTMTWGDALRHIGSSILQGVLQAISRMFAEWLVKRALIFAKELIFAKAEAAAKAPAAAATAISSYGTAAIVGTVAAIAAIGAITAAFMGAFKEGGYTGPGNPNAVAGVVHRGEFVMPADATNRIGLPALEAMKNGQASPVTPSAGRFAVAVFDDRSRMKEWLQSNEGKSTILDLVGQNRHEFI